MKKASVTFAAGVGAEGLRSHKHQYKTGLAAFLLMAALANGAWAGQPAAPAHEENDLVFNAANGEKIGTGARRPSADQWAWGEQHMVKAHHVKVNALGLARVNQNRKARGEEPLAPSQVDVAPLGAETQGTDTDQTALATAALPGYVDNSSLKYFPPIRNQGSLGSCAQFSAIYYTLTHMTALARNWDAKSGGDAYRFSPKWTYNVLNGGENVGTWHYDAYAIAQKHGAATWAEFPYDSDYRGWCTNSSTWRNALYMRADQTGKVTGLDSDTGLAQLKQMLLNGYVLNFATYINSWQWQVIGNDPATTTDDAFAGNQCVTSVSGTSGGHVMTIVGYNDAIWVDLNGDGLVTPDEKGALRIANSWGTNWGEAGFCWLSYQALRTRNPAAASEGAFWYDEATWVTARANYQPQVIGEFTVNHLTRNQLAITLGISDTTAYSPKTLWSPNRILSNVGGAWGFNGLSTAVDATFCLDFTDLAPKPVSAQRYYLRMRDSTVGNVAMLKGFKLIDLAHGREFPCDAVPQYADGGVTLVYATSEVAPQPVTEMSISRVDGGTSRISYSGGIGNQFVLTMSPDIGAALSTWTRVATNSSASGSFLVSVASLPKAFYRVISE